MPIYKKNLINYGKQREYRRKAMGEVEAHRKQYAASKPWKRAKMTKTAFENILIALPDDFIESIKLEADAERLLESAFPECYPDKSKKCER